ncbi:hypothetical protein GCM10009817_26280 [Terrabacter lapilli]|uniref:Uncharacterized protein n=1 Tax=Terrabacter lapilli TaxID=436231 RepID=A0ABN2SD36_9MICO
MAPVPDDDAARREPSTGQGSDRDTGGAVLDGQGSLAPAAQPGSLSPTAADGIGWVTLVTTVAAAGALLVAMSSGYAAALGVTLVLALALAAGWPLLTGSRTPAATSAVLAVSAVAIVLSAVRRDLQWVPAAVAFGIVLSFLTQLGRRAGREGLVLTLLSSFGGLVVMASGATAVVAVDDAHGRAVAVVAMAAVAAGVAGDLFAGARALARWLGVIALGAGMLVAVLAASRTGQVGTLQALGIGAAAGAGSWAFRRIFSLEPAMLTARGQVAAATGSVLAVGAVVCLFSLLT